MNTAILDAYAKELIKVLDLNASNEAEKEISSVIKSHAIAAAALGLKIFIQPGLTGAYSLAGCIIYIYCIYYRINKCLNLNISTSLYSLASAVCNNIGISAKNETRLNFRPGLFMPKTMSDLIFVEEIVYSLLFASGIIYLKLLTKIFATGKSLKKMTEGELREAVAETVKEEDVSQIIKDAKAEYKKARESGEVTGKETISLRKSD